MGSYPNSYCGSVVSLRQSAGIGGGALTIFEVAFDSVVDAAVDTDARLRRLMMV